MQIYFILKIILPTYAYCVIFTLLFYFHYRLTNKLICTVVFKLVQKDDSLLIDFFNQSKYLSNVKRETMKM